MSIYEPRAAAIKAAAETIGWQVQWRRKGSRVYVTVISKNANPFAGTPQDAKKWLKEWYQDPQITSASYKRWSFFVYDLIDLLKQ
jgi:hypothetical protein